MLHDVNLAKIKNIVPDQEISDQLCQMYLDFSKKSSLNCNVNSNSDFFLELSWESRGRALIFAIIPELKKPIWFQHYQSGCDSGFDFGEPKLDQLFKWIHSNQ